MPSITVKKKTYKENEIPIFDGEAVLYLVKDTWYFRCWIKGEGKYARKSLRTKSREMATERGKQEFYQLQTDLNAGRKFFSIDTKQAIQSYLDYRKNDVIEDTLEARSTQGGIVIGRYNTINTHLNHFLAYIGKDTKVRDLREFDLERYVLFRRKNGISDITIRQEISTINSAMSYIYDRLKQTDFRNFVIPQTLKHVTKSKNKADTQKIKRQTFTRDEWQAFYVAMRKYTNDCSVERCAEDLDARERQLVRHFCLFGANSGMRTGEQFNLLWKNVRVEKQRLNDVTLDVAIVLVDYGTSKKRLETREFWCRGGEYITRWKELAQHNDENSYVFSVDGTKRFPKTNFHRHWNAMLELAEIDESRKEHIVPYSLRHFCITRRVVAGLTFTDIAQNVGTSVAEIERTYNHIQNETRAKFAHARVKTADGITMPIIDETF
ncbi:tyrosine-type recombinase/integrase [Magnetovibrio blakemorei]|uniref:Integrase n=1 Tax=Magnetovibrio blakemorei TaxID=28181 RepID=A0A1E5QBS8_9PROT|nr:tyrosine-type recombinase/integrase [Magnetovibrio blakemorei]OEJ69526.1 hypothetical protein BEN30_02640 [Magnetovibrio blakemorei]